MKKKNAQQTRTQPMWRLLQFVIVGVIFCIAGTTIYQNLQRALQPLHDKLAYTVHDGSSMTLMLYDSATGEKSTLIEDFGGGRFNFSSDGRIVYQD